jgi:CBS-domain-containing membrane protein
MSPRAACRLETLGFDPALVFDYVEGKAGWLAYGLPREGNATAILYAGELVDADPPTCALDTPVADLRRALASTGYGFALVLTGHRILVGRVRRSALASVEASSTAEDVMEPGPSTVRFNTRADELVQRLARRDLRTAVVTTPNGCLVGVFQRAAAETRLTDAQ